MYPITNKKNFKQSLNLKGGSFYFLTGINKKDVRNSEQNIPLLSEIPFLGWLFKYESKQFEDINLTIILELIDDTAFHFSKFEDIKF